MSNLLNSVWVDVLSIVVAGVVVLFIIIKDYFAANKQTKQLEEETETKIEEITDAIIEKEELYDILDALSHNEITAEQAVEKFKGLYEQEEEEENVGMG